MKEIWKDIHGYEGLYQVSNLGRIKSLERVVNRKHNRDLHVAEKILKSGTYPNGYKYARLHRDGKTKNELVHRLVAIAFIENTENLPIINHKDECKDNNSVDNLEWCNHKYNTNYGSCIAKMKANANITKRAEKISKHVLQIDINGNVIKEWKSITEAEISINQKSGAGNISKCLRGKQPKAYGYIWRYAA
jgi:hypothetical protein